MLAYWAYRSAERLARTLPERTARKLFELGGEAAYRLAPKIRATVLENQAQVLGRPVADPLVVGSTKEAFRLYARYWFEAFRVLDYSDRRITREFEMQGLELLTERMDAGKGVIAVLPHMGNWDAVGRYLKAVGVDVVSVAERLRPERLNRLFLEHRRALGMRIYGTDRSHLGRQLKSELSQGSLVALVADRDLSGRGVEVQMFGRKRRLPLGPAMLSLSTGSQVFSATVRQLDVGWHCRVEGPIEIEPTGEMRRDAEALTRAIARAFERSISTNPADWHLFQPWGS
jgi:KDO2-lipid IV(A) lauroyltransferase